jgi:iron complex outermembrane receptor protein
MKQQLTALCICCAMAANAQQNLSDTDQVPDTTIILKGVTVTSRQTNNDKAVTIGKSPIAAMDLPQAITIVGKDLLDNQQAQRLSDALRNVNGVYQVGMRASTQENFSARGYTLGGNNFYKDGVRINSGTMPEMSGLERVEVLKGSAAILFGNVAPGGIVNLVTKQPQSIFGGDFSIRGGSFGLFKPAIDIYGPLSKGIAYRLNSTHETAGSYRDNVSSRRYYVNPSLLFTLGKRTELLVQGDYLYHHFTPDFGIGSINNTHIPDVSRSAFFGASWQYATTRQSSLNAVLKHRFNDRWSLNTSLSHQNYNRDYYSTERIQAQANGDFIRPLSRTHNNEDYDAAQVNLNGNIKTGRIAHTLLLGIDADRYVTKAWAFNNPTTYDTINILNPNKFTPRTDIPTVSEIRVVRTPTVRFGAYAQDLLSLSPKWKILVGLRWSLQEAKPAETTDLLTAAITKGAIKTDRAFSPRAGIVYRPTQNTSLFVSYANSFVVNSGTDVNGNALSPSIIDQYEAGIKNDFLGGKLTVNLTAYEIINNNLAQTAQFLADGVTPNNNTSLKALTGQTKSDGLEMDITAAPLTGLSVRAGYSYNFIRYTHTPDSKGSYVEGERLQNSVGSTANASVFYILKGWKFGVAAFYTGPRYAGFNNTKGQTQTYNRLFEVNDFATLDISAGYSIGKISFLAKVTNLTNTFNYYVHENYSINPIPPATLITTISYHF